MSSTVLTARERLYMITVVTLKAEYVDGERRFGSKAMGPDGKFTFHTDYLARALKTSESNAQKIRQACQRKGHIQLVHAGTFGRPATYQALVVRVDETNRLTVRRVVHPYGDSDPAVRVDDSSALTFRTPGQGDHAPESRGARWEPGSSHAVVMTDCRWHGHGVCPDDCADADRRRTA